MANAIELIKADHRKVEQLYQSYQTDNGRTPHRQTTAREIFQELAIHAQLEEEIFYPAVERKLGAEGATLVTEARKEHMEMKRTMSKLQAREFAGPECEGGLQEMMRGVQHHVKEEESELLPKAQQQLAGDLERLGTQMQQRKQELQHTKLRPRSRDREARVND